MADNNARPSGKGERKNNTRAMREEGTKEKYEKIKNE